MTVKNVHVAYKSGCEVFSEPHMELMIAIGTHETVYKTPPELHELAKFLVVPPKKIQARLSFLNGRNHVRVRVSRTVIFSYLTDSGRKAIENAYQL